MIAGMRLPYPDGILGLEISFVVVYLLIEKVRIRIASRGNKTEQVVPSGAGLLLAILSAIVHIYFIQLQTYVYVCAFSICSTLEAPCHTLAASVWTKSCTALAWPCWYWSSYWACWLPWHSWQHRRCTERTQEAISCPLHLPLELRWMRLHHSALQLPPRRQNLPGRRTVTR